MADPYLRHPSGWPVATLSPDRDLGFIVSAGSGSTPSTRSKEFWGGGYPWLTPKDISRNTDSVYVSTSDRTLTAAGLSRAGGMLDVDTVMLTKRAPVGCVAVNAVPMATNQGFMSFVCGPKLRPLYLAYWLLVNRPYLYKVANGSTYPELYSGDLAEFHIAVPPLTVQDAILAVVQAINYLAALGRPMQHAAESSDHLVKIQADDARLEVLLNQILPAMMSGDLEPGGAALVFAQGKENAM